MNITQILLGSTAALLLTALIFSYGSMKKGEAEDLRRQTASELIQENARLEAEIARLRSGGYPVNTSPKVELEEEKPTSMSEEKLKAIEEKNNLLEQQLAEAQKQKEQAEAETLAMADRKSGKFDKEERRARLISQAMVMAKVQEVAEDQGIYVIVLHVTMPQSVRVNTELAIRRRSGIIGRLVVSSMADGNVFADPLPGSFPSGEIDVKVGDELIIPPL